MYKLLMTFAAAGVVGSAGAAPADDRKAGGRTWSCEDEFPAWTEVARPPCRCPTPKPVPMPAKAVNTVCPMSFLPVNPRMTTRWQNLTVGFHSAACRGLWERLDDEQKLRRLAKAMEMELSRK
ncbi:MAG: hypothetical protein U0871_15060 [Gemmataceae bacterium]